MANQGTIKAEARRKLVMAQKALNHGAKSFKTRHTLQRAQPATGEIDEEVQFHYLHCTLNHHLESPNHHPVSHRVIFHILADYNFAKTRGHC